MEKLINKLKEEQYKIPFVSALVIGLVTHMFMIVNKFPNIDSMTNFYFDQNMITSGRWFLMIACGFSTFYDLNFVNGLLAIIFIAICAVYVTRFFDVKKKSSMILIPAVMATFPAVAATMSYMYTVDGYMLGLFGAVVLAFSMGTYQAYISVTILLCLFDIVFDVINNKDIYDVWNKGFKYLMMGIGGGALYFGILKLLLAIQHKELSDYQGINQMGKFNLTMIPERIAQMYTDFGAFAFRGRVFVNNIFTMIIMSIMVSVSIVAIFVLFGKNGAFKKWYYWLILLLCIALMPFGTNIMLLVSPGVEYHLLMRMQWEVFIIAMVVISEKTITAFESVIVL